MEVFQEIQNAIETWLTEISQKEERLQKCQTLKNRINQTITQIEFEEESIINIGRIQYVSDIWISILDLLSIRESKEQLIYNVLQLFGLGEISLTLTYVIIKDLTD